MPTNTNEQTQANGVANRAVGQIVTTSAAAAAVTLTLGFVPRVVVVENVTDRIKDEWYAGIDENAIYASLRGILTKLDSDGSVTDTDFLSLCAPASAEPADLKTSIEAMTAKLDADGGVTGTNFAALWNPSTNTAAALKAAIAGINAKLDADGGVTDTNYAATWDAPAVSVHTVANGTRTFELDNGIVVGTDGTVTLNATMMAASKVFSWVAEG